MISLLLLPFLTCLVLVMIHVYFGAFVLKRGVIFIDLALAQWAALGYLVGHWMQIQHPVGLFCIGFGFTVVASLILTALKPLYGKVNLQEAVIGVIYISGTTVSLGLISVTGMEGYHVKEMLAGHLLFIQWTEFLFACGLYSAIAVLLVWLHPYLISATGRKWDFIFYVLFGLVVTSSVKMVGVLLVFSFLVLPLLSVVLFYHQFADQMKHGWVMGILSSILGLYVSTVVDVPPSYCVILVLMAGWGISIVAKRFSLRLK